MDAKRVQGTRKSKTLHLKDPRHFPNLSTGMSPPSPRMEPHYLPEPTAVSQPRLSPFLH